MWQRVRDRLSQAQLSPDRGQQQQGETGAASTEIISSGDRGGAGGWKLKCSGQYHIVSYENIIEAKQQTKNFTTSWYEPQKCFETLPITRSDTHPSVVRSKDIHYYKDGYKWPTQSFVLPV